MGVDPHRRRSMAGVVVRHALLSLIPVVLLGAVLAKSYRDEATRRGVQEGRSQAELLAETAIAPLLDGRSLNQGPSPQVAEQLRKITAGSIARHDVLRLRLQSPEGHVVFSDDGSGFEGEPDDEALEAAEGQVSAGIKRLNSDSIDSGPLGDEAIEVYVPLRAGQPEHIVGVLEVYLPYEPIRADIEAGVSGLYRNLVFGLAGLYVALVLIATSVSRGLRRQVAINEFLAEHDTLTQLPNRSLFLRRVRTAVKASRRRPSVIAMFDLDRFKDVNDSLGHHNGDLLLGELARRLAAHTRPGDTIARLGGDEFGVVLNDVDATEAVSALNRLRAVVGEEVEVNGLPLSVEASVGYVVAPDDGPTVDELLQRADVAMYVAKDAHIGICRYDPEHDVYDAKNLSLVTQLRHAIDSGQLELFYQPKAVLTDGNIDAVEALLRWHHPVEGLVLPDRFIPLVEQTDVIDRLTEWVLVTALRDVTERFPGLSVAVNISARSLGRTDFTDHVTTALQQVGASPDRLILEITETALLVDPPRAAAVVSELNRAGVRVSLDDFGRGQTSLGYLSALPIHELKIDRTFVHDMQENPAHAAIVRSMIDLGHNLSLRVVGEGVETAEVLDSLREAGCDEAQGYLLARPMPAEAMVQWLAAHRPVEPART
jgi:diguanylate cyclase (GGDEF)-like protein